MPIKPTLPEQALRQIGLLGIQIITDRTARGVDADGKPFAPYGTSPFAMPYGGITAKARAALGDSLHAFKTKKGTLWAVITGGYAAFKKAAYPQEGGEVNLTATGTMMQQLTIVEVVPSTNTVVLGFASLEAATIAYYHNVAGAGPSKVRRNFMGFTGQELQRMAKFAGSRIVVRA